MTTFPPNASPRTAPLADSLSLPRSAADGRRIALAAALAFLTVPLIARADTFSDIRYTDLVARLGNDTPTGLGIKVGQVEAPENSQGAYAPDSANPEFAGVTFFLMSGSGAPSSWHATEVAKPLFGNTLSITPDVESVYCWNVNSWAGPSYLNVNGASAPATPPAGVRVFNHSWIGSFGSAATDNNALRRVDFLISRDNLLFTVGTNNGAGSAAQPLVSYAFNGISVGLANGNHANATTPAGIDGAGRRKPDIVAPGQFTSFSTPVVGAAGALLFDAAQSDPAVAGNPNANRALTVKAILLGGTTHRAGWSNGAPTSGASRGITATPLDPLYGTDLLNIDRAHLMLTSGEWNGSSTPQTSVFVEHAGWDYVPSVASGASVYYSFKVHAAVPEFSVLATWPRQVATNFSAWTLQNFDLRLWKLQGGSLASISGEAGVGVFGSGNVESVSTVDNAEHLYIRDLAAGEYVLELKRQTGTQSAQPVAVAWYMPPTAPNADFDGDGTVGATDLAILLTQWGTSGSADLNGDGTVSAADMAELLAAWG
ncbi:MAG: hypothetical protein GC172_11555 [Phycisphaera sp.]|nr:hypothetical protein [Phycisphaera sp.]